MEEYMVLIQKLRQDLQDLPRIVFIHEEHENLKGFVDDGMLTRNINKKEKHGVFKLIDVHPVTRILGESISSINMCNIVNL